MSDERLLYIYGVVDEVPADLGSGLEGAPLRGIVTGRVAAIVSEHASLPEGDEEGFWRHEGVVERLMAEVVVLPLRFGTTVTDAAAVEALLGAREEEFVRRFDEVRGAVELSVRAGLPDRAPSAVPGTGEAAPPGAGAPPESSSTGTEYMRERSRLLEERDRARDALHDPLAQLSRRALLLTGGGDAAFKGAYLVDADRVEAFAAQVGTLAGELQAEVSCTGPWPPYSFVAGEGR